VKAFIVDRYKKKGALRFGDMPEPALQDDDVLVEIQAAGLNLLDSKIRDGEFKLILPYRPPFIPGARRGRDRGSGRIESPAISSRVTRSMRDRVIAGSARSRNSSP